MPLSSRSRTLVLALLCLNTLPHAVHLPSSLIFSVIVMIALRGLLDSGSFKQLAPLRFLLPALMIYCLVSAIASRCFSGMTGVGTIFLLNCLSLLCFPLVHNRAMWLLILTYGLFFSFLFAGHNPASPLLCVVNLLAIASVLYEVHYPDESSQFIFSLLKNALMMSAIIATGLGILIALFPRYSINFLSAKSDKTNIGFGTGNDINPGQIAELATSDEVAFRARFTNGLPVSVGLTGLYWRGTTLALTEDGLRWYRAPEPPEGDSDETFKSLTRQEIMMEPRTERVLFALDTPIAMQTRVAGLSPRGQWGRSYFSESSITNRVLYQALSTYEPKSRPLSKSALAIYLRKPTYVDPRITELALKLREGATSSIQVAEHMMQYYFRNGFRYRLDPGKMEGGGLAGFLFDRKEGFCGHFATSFATVMRVAGVPSRIVLGFHGGELNEFDGTFIVKDQDAHAWVEIWNSSRNVWQRFDPTAMIAPLRLELGARRYNEKKNQVPSWMQVFRKWNMAWDALVTEWNYHRLGGDSSLFRGPKEQWQAWGFLIALTLFGLAPILFLIQRRRRQSKNRDELAEVYLEYCQVMQGLGLQHQAQEGPLDFLKRCESALPGFPGLPREFTRRYIELRYDRQTTEIGRVKQLKRLLSSLRKQARAHYRRKGLLA